MKKQLLFILILSLLFTTPSLAENAVDIDLDVLTVAELCSLKNDISKELTQRTLSDSAPTAAISEPILFRDFPWLSSEAEMLSNLKPLGYTSYTHGEGSGYTEVGSWEINESENFYEDEPLLSNREIGYWVSIPFKDNLKVAGFDVSYISMRFLYGHDGTNVYQDIDHSRMYSASYSFSVADPESTFVVLKEKLSTLYGEPKMISVDGNSYAVQHAIWYGADNTAVRMDMRIAKGDSNPAYALKLNYGISNSLELIAELQSVITNEIIAENSMDGL